MRSPIFVFPAVAFALAAAALFSAASSVGCSSSSNGGAPAVTPDVDASTCSDGFQSLGDAGGCAPVLPTSACAAGTSPTIGSTTCTPVGVAKCPTGFIANASGWGCDVVVPPTFCTGATRDAVGSATCVPVGDCTAAFPPANATLFVDASFTGGQIDSTHFASVSAALAVAPSGAVIAVESGTYSDIMAPTVAVSIVGRCAEQVVFQAADQTKSAIDLEDDVAVSFSNMTLSNYHGTIGALAGDVTLESIIVENSHFNGISIGNQHTTAKLNNVVVRSTRASATDTNAFGLYIGYGAQVTVTNSDFADNDYINVGASGDGRGGAKLDMSQSVVRNGHTFAATTGFGWGVYGADQVTIDLEQDAIIGNHGFGVLLNSQSATKSFATAVVTSSVVRSTDVDPGNSGAAGIGIESNKSSIDIEQSTVADSAAFDVYSGGGGQTKIVGSTLLGSSSTDPTVLGPIGLNLAASPATLDAVAFVGTRVGAQIEGASVAEIDDSIVRNTKSSSQGYYVDGNYVGVGLFVETGAQLTMKKTAVVGAHTAGIITVGQTTASALIVQGTRAGGDNVGGRGISAQAGATLTLDGAAILDNAESGLITEGGASLTLSSSTIDQTSFDPSGQFGIGILLDINAMATITSTTMRRSAGPALAVSGSGATVTSCALIDNAIGVSVQDGSSLVEGDSTGDPLTVAISSDTIFAGNQTRVGSGSIPLPPALTTPK